MEDHDLTKLLEEIRKGGSDAFERFYYEFGRQLVPFFMRHGLAGNVPDAEDLTQDTLLKMWTILVLGSQRFDSVAQLRSYLMRTARSVAIDRIRRVARDVPEVALDDDDDRIRPPRSTEVKTRVAEQGMARQELRATLDELSTNQRRALLLFEYHGYSYKEIAEIEGCTEGAVRSRLEEAREKIARRLSSQHDVSKP